MFTRPDVKAVGNLAMIIFTDFVIKNRSKLINQNTFLYHIILLLDYYLK